MIDTSVYLSNPLGRPFFFPFQIDSSQKIRMPIEIYDRETSSILLPIKEINKLEGLFIFRNASQIEHFLLQKKEVIPVLEEIYWHTVDKFGNVPVYLKLASDPEEDYEGLFVEIGSVLSLDESMALVDETIDWFIESVPDEIREYLTITLK